MTKTPTGKVNRNEFLADVGKFVSRLRAEEGNIERAGALPDEMLDEMASLGLFGMLLPGSVGGLDLDMETASAAMVQIGSTHPALRVALSGTNGPAGAILCSELADLQAHSDGQGSKAKLIGAWLAGMASGRIRAALAMSEPVGGSRLDLHATRANRDNGRWRVDGFKSPVTEGGIVDLVLLLAVTDPSAPLRRRFSLFAVTRDEFRVAWQEPTWASRAQQLAGLSFRDVSLPGERLLGEPGRGLSLVSAALAQGRILMASAGLGLCERLLSETALKVTGFSSASAGIATAHMLEGQGQGLADEEAVQAGVGGMLADLVAVRWVLARAVELFDDFVRGGVAHHVRGGGRRAAGGPSPRIVRRMASAAKLQVAETAVRIADGALGLLGAEAVLENNPVGIFLRQARMLPLAEGGAHVLRRSLAADFLQAARAASVRAHDQDASRVSPRLDALANLDSFWAGL